MQVIDSIDPKDVCKHLVHIFSIYGAPCILESFNGRDFARKVARGVQKVCS